eukprot:257535-Amphidinium_carterae.1
MLNDDKFQTQIVVGFATCLGDRGYHSRTVWNVDVVCNDWTGGKTMEDVVEEEVVAKDEVAQLQFRDQPSTSLLSKRVDEC